MVSAMCKQGKSFSPQSLREAEIARSLRPARRAGPFATLSAGEANEPRESPVALQPQPSVVAGVALYGGCWAGWQRGAAGASGAGTYLRLWFC